MTDLPVNWGVTKIGELCRLVNGRAFKPSDWSLSGLPIVRIQNLNRPDAKFNFFDRPVAEKFLVKTGDLLFAWSGTPGTSFGAHIWNGSNAILNQHIFNVHYDDRLVDKLYFRYAINQTLDKQIAKAHGGVGLAHVTKGLFEETAISLPPLPEQRRIVAKIESVSGKSKRSRDQLDHIPRLVEKYKQAVLAAAFRGDLTKQWREGNANDEGPWRDIVLKDIAEIQSGIALGKKRSAASTLIIRPYLRVANVQRGWLDLEETKEVEVTEQEALRLYLRPGDILMNEGGDRDKLGRGWVWEGQVENCIHQNHVFRVRLHDRKFPPKLISLYANEFGQMHFFDEGTQTTNLASISKTRLSSLPLRLPPAKEGIEMLRRIEIAYAWIIRLAKETQNARKLIDHLDQAVLAKAFRGELVTQDPSDEPASVLLERIRAERAASPTASRRSSSRGRLQHTKA